MAKIEKPDFKQAKKTIKSAEGSLQSLNNLITKKEGYEQNIRSNYEKLQIEAGKKELSSMDIEILNTDKDGIRISTLKSAGILTIAQVLSYSPARLCTINGIGEATAQKIITNAKAIEESTVKNCSITLSPEDNCWAMKWDLEKPCRPSLPSAIWQQRAEAIFW